MVILVKGACNGGGGGGGGGFGAVQRWHRCSTSTWIRTPRAPKFSHT